MPKRVIDFDAMWASDKLAACAAWAQAEYAWLYGLADCAGCFELTNLRVIWGRVAAIRRNFSIERLEQVIDEFHDKRLLFIWTANGKRYGHWTGSDVPGRLPPPSWRNRLERLAPPVPREQLEAFLSEQIGVRGESRQIDSETAVQPITIVKNAGRDAGTGTGPNARGAMGPASASRGDAAPLKAWLEPPQAQGLDLDREGKREVETHIPCLEVDQGEECVENRETPQIPEVRQHTEKHNRMCEPSPLFAEKEKPEDPCLENNPKPRQEIADGRSGNENHGQDGLGTKTKDRSESQSLRFDDPHGSKPELRGPTPEMLAEIWERERGSLPELRGLTPERVARCRERFANARKGGRDTPDAAAQFVAAFREAVRRAAATPFLCGEGPAGWRANFDWIVANDTNYLKVLEGRYDSGAGDPALRGNYSGDRSTHNDWSARAVARDEMARRMARVGLAPEPHPSVRVRADVLQRALHRE